MLGLSPLPSTGSAGLVSNTIGPDFGQPVDNYAASQSASLNRDFPNAVDGDGVIQSGPTDGLEVWVKVGSGWNLGWEPGTVPPMTLEYRPTAKRIIYNQFSGGNPQIVGTGMTKSSGISTGHIALIGLLGFLLLRGTFK